MSNQHTSHPPHPLPSPLPLPLSQSNLQKGGRGSPLFKPSEQIFFLLYSTTLQTVFHLCISKKISKPPSQSNLQKGEGEWEPLLPTITANLPAVQYYTANNFPFMHSEKESLLISTKYFQNRNYNVSDWN